MAWVAVRREGASGCPLQLARRDCSIAWSSRLTTGWLTNSKARLYSSLQRGLFKQKWWLNYIRPEFQAHLPKKCWAQLVAFGENRKNLCFHKFSTPKQIRSTTWAIMQLYSEHVKPFLLICTWNYFSLGAFQLPLSLSLSLSLSLFSSASLSWLLSHARFFPFFLPLPTPVDRVSPNRCLKARHEADSFDPAEWSERLPSKRSGWLGAAAAGLSPAFSTFFSLLFLFFQRQYSSSARKITSLLALFSCLSLFSSAGLSWLLSYARFFPFFLPLPTPVDRVSPNRCLKAGPPLIWVFGHFWLFCTMV